MHDIRFSLQGPDLLRTCAQDGEGKSVSEPRCKVHHVPSKQSKLRRRFVNNSGILTWRLQVSALYDYDDIIKPTALAFLCNPFFCLVIPSGVQRNIAHSCRVNLNPCCRLVYLVGRHLFCVLHHAALCDFNHVAYFVTGCSGSWVCFRFAIGFGH